jgi:digeranylgeranylglycerophospholipid reductase
MHDVVIVGGGPAGSKAAALLAGDRDVVVLEEHDESGDPVECTGLVTESVLSMSGIRINPLNRLYGARVHFPGRGVITARSKAPKAVLIDRRDFDRRMADAASDAGAEFLYGRRYESHIIDGDRVRVRTPTGCHVASLLIGADGHTSAVAASVPDNDVVSYVRGIQVDVRCRRDDQELMDIRLGSEVAPGFFSWEIPFGEFTRIGVCTAWSAGPPNDYLKVVLRRAGMDDAPVVEKCCGKIPIGGRRASYGDHMLLIGDAAGQVKPVSGGGLHPMLCSAPFLKEAAERAFDTGDFSSSALSSYERGWKGKIGESLSKGMKLREMYNRLDDDALDKVYSAIDRPNVRQVLDDIDLDDPVSVAEKLIRNIPLALRLAPIYMKARL